MSKAFTILKSVCHILPAPLRNAGPLRSLALRIMEKVGDRDDIYSPKYYQTMVEPYARKSVPQMAQSIVATFHPQSAVDIGCGSGALLVALRKLGVRRLLGIDAAEAGLDMAQARGLDTRKLDLATDTLLYSACYDIAISMETAEHLPASAADRYIELLCSLAPIVIFTAAHPGQGGIGHLNEQPPEYWIGYFKAHGFQCLPALSKVEGEKTVADWRPVWRAAGVADFYTNNLMIFQRI
jgi:SAM-dependent methyltransferase